VDGGFRQAERISGNVRPVIGILVEDQEKFHGIAPLIDMVQPRYWNIIQKSPYHDYKNSSQVEK
jgi:hypothetical protein